MINKQANRKRTQKVLPLMTLIIMLVIMFTKTISVNAEQEPLENSEQELINISNTKEDTKYETQKDNKETKPSNNENIDISFAVLDKKGNPLDGAEFALKDKYTNALILKATSEKGKVLFPNVANADYLIEQLSAPSGYLLHNDVIAVKNAEICIEKGFREVCTTNDFKVVNITTQRFIVTIAIMVAVVIILARDLKKSEKDIS